MKAAYEIETESVLCVAEDLPEDLGRIILLDVKFVPDSNDPGMTVDLKKKKLEYRLAPGDYSFAPRPKGRTIFVNGERVAGVYTYQPGDVLPPHTHPEGGDHETEILSGVFEVIGSNEIAGQSLKKGTLVIWEAGIEHGFLCKKAGKMLNTRSDFLDIKDKVRAKMPT